jgi:Resolvase, N terminal domain
VAWVQRLCCDYAQRQGYAVARVYEDAAASGASIHGRPGIQRMLADAEHAAFDVLLCESMSRIGRDQEHRANIRKRLGRDAERRRSDAAGSTVCAQRSTASILRRAACRGVQSYVMPDP